MKKVYIVHPLRGDIEHNLSRISSICRYIVDHEPEIIPLSPVLAFNFFDPDREPRTAMRYCLEMLATSDEAWAYHGWTKSEGCRAEVDFANCHGIPVQYHPPL